MQNSDVKHPKTTRVIDALFTISLMASFLLGIVMVVLQVIATVIGASTLIVNVSAVLGPPTYAAAATAGVLSLVAMYLHGWSTAE